MTGFEYRRKNEAGHWEPWMPVTGWADHLYGAAIEAFTNDLGWGVVTMSQPSDGGKRRLQYRKVKP